MWKGINTLNHFFCTDKFINHFAFALKVAGLARA